VLANPQFEGSAEERRSLHPRCRVARGYLRVQAGSFLAPRVGTARWAPRAEHLVFLGPLGGLVLGGVAGGALGLLGAML
jgi:hypothetical protein